MTPHAAAPGLRLGSEFSSLRLDLDPATGLPVGLGSGDSPTVPLRVAVGLLHGGTEARGEVGGLSYPGSTQSRAIRVRGPVTSHLLRDARCHVVPVAIAGWLGELRYTFRTATPSLTWTWRLSPGDGAETLRNLELEFAVGIDPSEWILEAPGSRLRPHLPAADLASAGTPVSSIGGALGSAGVVALSRGEAGPTLVIWPRSRDEAGSSLLRRTAEGVSLRHTLNVAAAAEGGTDLLIDGVALDLVAQPWPAVLAQLPSWYDALGVSTPRDRPGWVRGATIYEVQLGTSVFAGGTWTYSPYPEPADLLADLPRIRDLGFDTIQVMPRQPFPSYNVIDYDDVETTWGNEEVLGRVIAWCHAHGLRVILDIVLHGVIDQESIRTAADAVRAGRWAPYCRASSEELDEFDLSVAEYNQLTWSRHILDFEDAWTAGAPPRHPLTREHPDWFCTDSAGSITGVYTKAFDMSNPDWQDSFIAAAIRLVRRLGIDGFRFDAPGYNNFPNWSQRTRSRASLQQLGATGLFARLRTALRAVDPELMLYTEENGPLWRQDVDLNYNYDEFWLPDSLFGSGSENPPSRVRHGRDLAEWLRERDCSLPAGSLTAHHIDSHDSFWFLLPGRKWRREQIGIEATRALICAYALAGGPFMMFVGGEEAMVDLVRLVNRLRRTRPELAGGSAEYARPAADSDELFTVHHRGPDGDAVLAVNLSGRPVTSRLDGLHGPARDLLDGSEADLGQALSWAPFQARYLVGRR